MKQKNAFLITINDGINIYTYDFHLDLGISSFDIANVIAEKYGVDTPLGVHFNKNTDVETIVEEEEI
jgi:hypothetical protein